MGVSVEVMKLKERPMEVRRPVVKAEQKCQDEPQLEPHSQMIDQTLEDYKQIKIIDTMEVSEDDGSKKIYLLTNDDADESDSPSELM